MTFYIENRLYLVRVSAESPALGAAVSLLRNAMIINRMNPSKGSQRSIECYLATMDKVIKRNSLGNHFQGHCGALGKFCTSECATHWHGRSMKWAMAYDAAMLSLWPGFYCAYGMGVGFEFLGKGTGKALVS